MSFENIKVSNEKDLQKIMAEIEKLNSAKMNFNIQKIQTMDISNKKKVVQNVKILAELNNYLSSANEFKDIESKYADAQNEAREGFKESIIKKNISDDAYVNLTTTEDKVRTLLELAFKTNKYTKWLCKEAWENIQNINFESDSFGFINILYDLKHIYKEMYNVDKERSNFNDEIKNLAQKIKEDESKDELDRRYSGWKNNLKKNPGNNVDEEFIESFLKNIYSELFTIWSTESQLYEIKTQLNKQLVRVLIADNNRKFKNWGFCKDDEGIWTFNFDSGEIVERYSFHVPNMKELLNKKTLSGVYHDKLKYNGRFTKSVRKNTLDRIDDENKGLGVKCGEFIGMLQRELIDIEQIKTYKFMSKDDYDYIKKIQDKLGLGTKLTDRMADIKEIINPTKSNSLTENFINSSKENTESEEQLRRFIEIKMFMHPDKLYIQRGSNLDISASIYAIKKHMEEYAEKNHIEIKEIKVNLINSGAEKTDKDGLYIDAGVLRGVNVPVDNQGNFNENVAGEINANISRGEKSTCGVLKKCGIDIPDKIVEYADIVLTDERILDARYGVNLIRWLKDEKLFEFGKSKRKDGSFLIESSLTEEEIEKFGLTTRYNTNEKDIREAIPLISENIYKFKDRQEEKKIAIVTKGISSGAMISYGLDCDYYFSVSDPMNRIGDNDSYEKYNSIPLASFAINANPSKGDGKLPKTILDFCRKLAEERKIDIEGVGTLKLIKLESENELDNKESNNKESSEYGFVSDTEDKAIFGGFKTKGIFVTLENAEDDIDIKDAIMYSISDLINAKKVAPKEAKKSIIEKSKQWKNNNARELVNELLSEKEEVKIVANDIGKAGFGTDVETCDKISETCNRELQREIKKENK